MKSLEEHFKLELQKAFVAGFCWCKNETKPRIKTNQEIWIVTPTTIDAEIQARLDYR